MTYPIGTAAQAILIMTAGLWTGTAAINAISELTDAEVAQMQVDAAAAEERRAEEDAAKAALAALKTSARGKLVAGTPLTEAEAATLVI